MTYEEIKDRLTKCETILKKVQSNNTTQPQVDVVKLEEKITFLKESLTKKAIELKLTNLKEQEDKGTEGTVSTDDEGEAEDLAKKGVNVKLTKEQADILFTVEETKAIAKEVAKSLLAALRDVGDEVASGKIKNIEENSFDIFVEYKNDFEDEFSFFIKDDRLHLVDFSFDKEIGEVGVKPSGEAIVHKDVITNNLVKHFQALNEQEYAKDIEVQADEYEEYEKLKNSKEVNEAPYQTAYIKVPVRDYKKAMQILDANIDSTYVKMDIVDDDGDGNVIIYFKFRDTSSDQVEDFEEDPQAFVYDAIMDLRANGIAVVDTSANLGEGKQTEAQLKEYGPMYGSQNKEYSESDDIKRIGEIDDLLTNTDNQEAFYAWDRAANTYLGRGDAQYWADLDPQDLELAIDDGEDIIRKYNLEGINEEENDRQKYLRILDMYKRAGRIDRKTLKPKLEKAAKQLGIKLQLNEHGEIEGADMEVGHQDDEPSMLKKDIYDIAVYAAKLYKQLDKYDQMDGEVDFPHWWQGKVIKAREFMSSAQHYLEAEEKQPLIDQLALEGKEQSETLKEGTELWDAPDFNFKRFSGGAAGPHLQITAKDNLKGDYKYIILSPESIKSFAKATQAVAQNFGDISRQVPLNEEATCCGKCGRVHVKGNCKRPFLKGAKHCRNNK